MVQKHAWPTDLLQQIRKTVEKPSRQIQSPEFAFKLTKECTQKNFLVLKKYDFNLEHALAAQKGTTPLEYGSEFRTADELAPIFQDHLLWESMKENLTTGATFPLEELDKETRLLDFTTALERGNHKGAQKKPDLLKELVTNEVIHGYGLPLPLSVLIQIPGTLLAPMNIQAQNTINEFGKIIAKDRLTYDQSFDFSPNSSVNSRVIWDNLPPVRYGHCIQRIINWAVATKRKFPNKRILASKIATSQHTIRCTWPEQLHCRCVHKSQTRTLLSYHSD